MKQQQVFGNSATYFTRADENRLDELSRLLGLNDEYNYHNSSTTNSTTTDPLARSVYESEYQELKRRKDRFIEESLDNMMRAAKQQKSSAAAAASSSRVFHAFDSNSADVSGGSRSYPGDGSFSYLLSRAVSTLLNSFSSSTNSAKENEKLINSSSVPTIVSPREKTFEGDNNNNREISSLISRKQSDADFMMHAPTPSKNKRSQSVSGGEADEKSTSSSSSSSMFILPISVTFAWSIFGICSLALLMQSLMHFQDPSRTIRKSSHLHHQHQELELNNHNHDHDYHYNYNSNGVQQQQQHASIFHEESFMSMLLRLSEGFLGFVGCSALILHLNFVASTPSSSSSSSSLSVSTTNSGTVLSGRNTALHSRSTSLQNLQDGGGNNNNLPPSAFSPVVVPIVSLNQTAFHTSSLVANEKLLLQQQQQMNSSTPVRLLLRISEVGTLFFGVYALAYAAFLLAPLKHLSSDNYLKQHIMREQNLRHVEVGLVLLWIVIDALCALSVRRIMFVAEQVKVATSVNENVVV
jgi:hypothetical protein